MRVSNNKEVLTRLIVLHSANRIFCGIIQKAPNDVNKYFMKIEVNKNCLVREEEIQIVTIS